MQFLGNILAIALFIWSGVEVVNGYEHFKSPNRPARFTLIVVFIPIRFDTSTWFNGVIVIAKGLFILLIALLVVQSANS